MIEPTYPTPLGNCPQDIFTRFQKVSGVHWNSDRGDWIFLQDEIEIPKWSFYASGSKKEKTGTHKKFVTVRYYNFCLAMSKCNYDIRKAVNYSERYYFENYKPKYMAESEGYSSYKAIMDDFRAGFNDHDFYEKRKAAKKWAEENPEKWNEAVVMASGIVKDRKFVSLLKSKLLPKVIEAEARILLDISI